MGRLLPFLVLANIALIAMALFDCATTDRERVRSLSKRAWVLVILLLSPFGAIAWFVGGRVPDDQSDLYRAGGAERVEPSDAIEAAPPAAAKIVPPDDDPEFLRQLEIRVREAKRLNKDQLNKDQPPADE